MNTHTHTICSSLFRFHFPISLVPMLLFIHSWNASFPLICSMYSSFIWTRWKKKQEKKASPFCSFIFYVTRTENREIKCKRKAKENEMEMCIVTSQGIPIWIFFFGPNKHNEYIQFSVCWQLTKRQACRIKSATVSILFGDVHIPKWCIHSQAFAHYDWILWHSFFLSFFSLSLSRLNIYGFWSHTTLNFYVLSDGIIMPFAWTDRCWTTWIIYEIQIIFFSSLHYPFLYGYKNIDWKNCDDGKV